MTLLRFECVGNGLIHEIDGDVIESIYFQSDKNVFTLTSCEFSTNKLLQSGDVAELPNASVIYPRVAGSNPDASKNFLILVASVLISHR